MSPLATYKTNPVEYRAWSGMWTRCTNPKFVDWALYGGRGIRVCERWKSFGPFFADIGPKTSPKHSLDRIDSDGHYEPGNCRWATPKEQANNWKTRNRRIEHNGETLSLPEWALRLGIARESLRNRLDAGWPVEKALSVPAIRARGRDNAGRFV